MYWVLSQQCARMMYLVSVSLSFIMCYLSGCLTFCLSVFLHLPLSLSRFRVFRRIKEQHCYCAPDLAKEYSKYDTDPRKFFRKYTGKRVRGAVVEWGPRGERVLLSGEDRERV